MSMMFEQGQQMHPALVAVQHAEIFENLTTGQTSLSEKYAEWSEMCQENKYSYFLFTGPNGAGKTETVMGARRVMLADEALSGHDIIPVPFALFGDVAKMKGKIRQDAEHGGYTSEEYAAITREMFNLTQDYKYKHPEKKAVFLYEMSTPSVYPDVPDIYQLPWDMENRGPVPVKSGNPNMVRDRGHSTGYGWALSKEAKAVQMVVVERSEEVKKITDHVRGDSSDVIGNMVESGVTVLLEDKSGTPVDLTTVDREVYNELNRFLRTTYAPRASIAQSDSELVEVRNSIPYTSIPSERGWYEWLRQQLLMDKKRFSVVQNEYLEGDKTFDIGYFTDSIVYKLYPQLLSPAIRKLIDPTLSL